MYLTPTQARQSACERGSELREGEGGDRGMPDGDVMGGRDKEQTPLSLLFTHNWLWWAMKQVWLM